MDVAHSKCARIHAQHSRLRPPGREIHQPGYPAFPGGRELEFDADAGQVMRVGNGGKLIVLRMLRRIARTPALAISANGGEPRTSVKKRASPAVCRLPSA